MTIFNVSNSSQLMSALNQASGGDEIRLASGDYGELNLQNVSFNNEVTITSANDGNPASFSGLDLFDVDNLTFDNVVFDYQFGGETRSSHRPFSIENSQDITIENSSFEGDDAQGVSNADDGYGFGVALFVEGSTGVTLDNNEVFNFFKGPQFFDSTDIVVKNNDIYDLRSDGLNFVEVQGVLIEGNNLHDFEGSPNSGDHRDFIQFWKANTDAPSTDIIIRDNRFDIGDGSFTQTIFLGNSGRENRELYYQNVLIEGNEIFAAHHHGITVGLADGVVIRDNIVVQVDQNFDAPHNAGRSGGVTIPKINVDSESLNVTIEGNVTPRVNGLEGQRDWTVTGNIEPQDSNPSAPGYLPDLLELREEPISVSPPASSEPAQEPVVVEDPAPEQEPLPEEPVLVEDPVQEPELPASEPVSAEPDEPEQDAPEVPQSDQRGTLEIDDFVLDISGLAGSDLRGDTEIAQTANGPVLQFDGNRDFVSLGRLEEFEASDEITFSVDFSRDVADGEDARLVWNHQKIGLGIEDDGIYVRVGLEGERWKTFRSEDIGLNDTDLHRATVIVDDNSDRLQVIVDDQVVIDESGFDFEINGNGGREWGWSLGTKWARWLDGDISDFRVEADADFDHNYAPIDDSLIA